MVPDRENPALQWSQVSGVEHREQFPAQLWQVEACTLDHFPAGQAEHEVAPPALNVPGSHWLQINPDKPYPLSQDKQIVPLKHSVQPIGHVMQVEPER
jgi:hypothetical protein